MIDDDRLKPEQRAAKDALDRNVSLSAGAGTGKTTTLTARYVAIVERELATVRERLDDGSYTREAAVEHAASIPEHVLTTTFTDRAAADLTGTVREEINAKLSVADDEETFALWRAVGDALDDAYVQTLHSLCRRLLEERAIGGLDTPRVDPSHRLSKYGMTYVDLDVGFDVVEEDEAEELAREAAAATLREEESDAIGTLARRYDRGTVEDICYDLLTTSPRSDAYAWLEWMAEVDDADAYAERILGLAIEVSPRTSCRFGTLSLTRSRSCWRTETQDQRTRRNGRSIRLSRQLNVSGSRTTPPSSRRRISTESSSYTGSQTR
ncbi:UvrD-helicase domain-containing protein [Halobaculum litoreum]|uniref:UvrD-helicase domain-containing protein n=1 Tax=Halobaculum litoreum TaxID=3031998 RepID=A0ABD5XW26_9EURY